MKLRITGVVCGAGLVLCGAAGAYPGGTPGYQTDAAPFCAACHSSRKVEALAGVPGDRATKELVENKHLALIRAGKGGYEKLTPEQRTQLIEQIRALDEASTVTLGAPLKVRRGETFKVTVDLTGGAGPVVGAALLDTPHRWLARPIASEGFLVVGPPTVIGQDFQEQHEWLSRRPEALGRNLSFVNVTGISSDSAKREWGRAQVIWTLRAPQKVGSYTLVVGYFYGTEKASPLGFTEDPIRGKLPRGGFGGHSGRILFSKVHKIQVQ